MIKDLNRAGLTAFGSAGCDADVLPTVSKLGGQGQLNVRVFCINGVGVGSTPEQVERSLPRIAQMKLFQGDNYIDHIVYGESVYGPLHDPMFMREVRSEARAARAVAPHRDRDRQGRPAAARAREPDATRSTAFLDQIEAINKEYPIKNLRWVLAHVEPAQRRRSSSA